MDTFKPGDYYEDCSYHPCLCTEADEEEVSGISLIDGSYPRCCSITDCGIRKLTLPEVLLWKNRGPQNLEEPWSPPPDKQWWWPRPIEGINPSNIFEFLFDSSLNFLRNSARAYLGEEISGWYAPSGQFNDSALPFYAEVSYRVKGSIACGSIKAEASKEGRLWSIQKIMLLLDSQDKPFIFEGKQVRGCGYAG